jgi:hypothetical protein
MNKEQQELLDEAYDNYFGNFYKLPNKFKWMKEVFYSDGNYIHHVYLRGEFINKCKKDAEFSEKWGLTIKERELSYEERQNLYFKLNPEFRLVHEDMDKHMDKHNTPIKLITITYQNKKIESYEN